MSDHSIYLEYQGFMYTRCRLGAQRHPLTYVGRRRFQDGTLRQIWYLTYVTPTLYRYALDILSCPAMSTEYE
jgi:hypothetical protein